MPSPNAAKNDYRRQQLIAATMRCISEHGLSGTTISRVTKQANLSNGIVNFYFDSKLKLLMGTLESLHDEFQSGLDALVAENETAERCLPALVDFHFDPIYCDVDKIAVWHAFSSDNAHRQAYMATYGQHELDYFQRVTRLFADLCAKSDRPAASAEPFARAFIGLIDEFWLSFLFEPQTFDPEASRQQCHVYLSSLFPDTFRQNKEKPNTTTVTQQKLERSDLLAPWTYHNEELLQLEIQHLFKEQWLLVGHLSEVANPLDFITFDALGERVLVLRGQDNQLRAFHNVCRHRGAKLLDKTSGQCSHMLSCPFHGWTYDSSGNLVAVPARQTFAEFELADNGLVPVDLEIWHGFIFIRIQGDAPSVAEQMKPIEDLIAPYQIENMTLDPKSRYRDVRPYNWKVIHDIDNEGYHVPVGHPALQQLYGKQYLDEVIEGIPVSRGPLNDRPARNWSVKHYQKILPRFDHLPEENQRLWQYTSLFPSMVIGMYPESIEFYMTLPKSINETWYIGASLWLEDDRREARAARYLTHRINRQTDDEDESFVGWMQDGLQSSALPDIKLSAIESGVRDFHHKLQKAVPVCSLKQAPVAGHVAQMNRTLQSD